MLLGAYAAGYFPMPVDGGIGWFSPDPRAIFPLDGLRVSRSLRRSLRRYRVTVDQDFDAVIRACADPDRPHGWIDDQIIEAYARLHLEGFVHSVEAWSVEDGSLAGGLYGVALGGLFAGESMFSAQRDASKVALLSLVERMRAGGGVLLDTQWLTPHLASLGAIEVPRARYLSLLEDAVERPQLRL
jgi:leucyl/phenylalanyl-tRNA--protein transferase